MTIQAVNQSVSQSIEVRAAFHSDSTGRSCAEDVYDDGVSGTCSLDETVPGVRADERSQRVIQGRAGQQNGSVSSLLDGMCD